MTVYVDKLQWYAKTPTREHWWCHMWSDTGVEELKVFAERIGMNENWFQDHKVLPHFDLTPGRRYIAIEHGAKERDVKDFLRDQMRIANE